jgi:hypothetical protein
MIDFSEAEAKFRELQSRVQRGEPLSEEQYQEELAKLMLQDDHGVFWSLEPGTGRWLFVNGTEWGPGTPPRPAPPSEPMPEAEAVAQPGSIAPQGTTEPAPTEYAPSGEVPAIESESVPTYVRTTDVRESATGAGTGGIPPRPVRGTFVAAAEGERPWLPFAIGAIVLMLCAVALFFGVRNAPFLGGAAATATATEVAIVEASPTEAIAPTDTVPATATRVPTTPAPRVVTVTTTDNVRVRSGPGTKFGVLATMANGTTLTAVGRNADSSWLQIQQPGKTDLGWVTADFVTVSGDVNSLPVVESQPTPAPTKKPAQAKPSPTETPAG